MQEQGTASFFELASEALPQQVFDSVVQPLQDLVPDQGVEEDGGDVQLDGNQQTLVDHLSLGQLSFVHGSAGTGKSTIIRALAWEIRGNGAYEPIILAPSGVTAKNVGGCMIHAFFGASATDSFEVNLFTLDWRIHILNVNGKEPLFIIDEVSMCSADMLNAIFSALEKVSWQPYAVIRGYPLVLVSDVSQLGPVLKRGKVDDASQWMWNADRLQHFEHYVLSHPYCQQGDQHFFDFLETVHQGNHSQQDLDFVRSVMVERMRAKPSHHDNVMCLTATHEMAQEINQQIQEDQPEETLHKYVSQDNIQCTQHEGSDFLECETGLVHQLVLWPGALVMVTTNLSMDMGLVNGTVARVVWLFQDQVRVRLANNTLFDIHAIV